ncbi:hypothetical protein HGRIS_013016 [Hohenbuehelia grisea]|uniref:Mitotic checkpoint regulator, MAD2B-interacting-domain-containing protein n=1 Tax=Hohenbuehelia grisea TaxID=104357 RepID=A0ABR3IUA6_9AGAR
MFGIESYGSGSESDDNDKPTQVLQAPKPPVKAKRATKKIAIGLPALAPTPSLGIDDDDDLKSGRPPAKKPRLEAGAGVSSLLSMLPAPKQKTPVVKAPERVLGAGKGPGLVFKTTPSVSAPPVGVDKEEDDPLADERANEDDDGDVPGPSTKPFAAFMPTSVLKGKANISVEEEDRPKAPARTPKVSAAPAADFFSLGSSSSSQAKVAVPSVPSLNLPTFSSAPDIPTFKPPTPTREDAYPGYYLLPSGAWAAHDPAYYNSFLKKWQKEYDDHVRALEKGLAKGFEGADDENVAEINAMKEMERAKLEIQAREEKKAVTKDAAGEPAKPRMNIDPAKLGGRARSRHQLSSLLTEAYQNREALEDKIAEGRRNRKEAGNKYGF